MSSEEGPRSLEGPFSPGWVATTVKSDLTPKPEKEVKSAKKQTPREKKSTPKRRNTSPQSEFGYEDAFTPGGDDFVETAVRKANVGARRKSPKAKKFHKAKQTFLAPTTCSTVKQRSKAAEMGSSQPLKTEGAKTLTVPVSPHFRKVVSKGKEQKLTSEELLLQKLDQEKHAESERIAKAQKLYAMLKTRSNRRNSKLYGTNLLESAVKAKAPAVRQFVQPKKVAPSAVQASAIKRGQDGLTLFEPFQFATDKRAPPTTAVMATPDRVRAMPAAELAQKFMKDARSHGAPVNAAKKLTIGQSPKLRTQKRGQYAATSKPRMPTQEERVSAEMEEISRHPFRARRLDRRIFDSAGELGVPKVAARPVTEPMEFEFRADKRTRPITTSVSPTKRNTTSFKAKPAPKVTSKMPNPKTKTVFKPTVAMSPKFNGGARASVAPVRRQRVPFSLTAAAATAPAASREPLKITEPKEFKFRSDNRGEFHKAQMQKQLAQEQEALAAAREVKAHPMPDFNKPVFQPDLVTHKAPLTESKPFQLRSTARHSDAVAAFQQEVTHIAEAEKAVAFHARPVPATTYKPDLEFTEPVDHTPIVPLPVTLESDRRALKRQAFDQVMGQKMAQLEVMQETLAKQKLEQENSRIKELRRKSVEEGGLMFKAKPIITKDQFPTRAVPSTPLTTPLSPQLRTGSRPRYSATISSATAHTSSSVVTRSSASLSNTIAASATASTSSVVKATSGLSGGAKRITSSVVSDQNAEKHQAELAQALSTM